MASIFARRLKGMHVLIAAGSLVGFVGGWALLAHAPKPEQVAAPEVSPLVEPAPTLAPLQFNRTAPALQPLPTAIPLQIQPQLQRRTRLRTGGS